VAEQSRIFEQYTAFVQRLSAQTPLILFLDDLQWADNASLGLLFHLGRRIESSRILILGAYRPTDMAVGRYGERHPLEPVVHELTRYHGDVTMDLDAIPDRVNRQFVDAVLDAEPNRLGQAFRKALFHQTGGHALFTVELIRDMRERGDLTHNGDGYWVEGPSLDWDALPAKVEGVIAERVGRLDEELEEMVMVASVEGEQFTAEVMARVQAIGEREAIRLLSDDLQRRHRLVSALGLAQFGHLRLSLYHFVHNLFQQYLYGSLGEAERACLHREVGEAIEALFAGETEEVAAQLARHFEEGGIPTKAAAYRLQAGNRAHRMSAHQEAAAHFSRGLELLADLPPGPERTQLELGLQISLGRTLIATHGYASPQVEKVFARARELSRTLNDPSQLIPVLYGLCVFSFVRAELQKTYAEGEQLLLLTQQVGDIDYFLGTCVPLGASAYHLGRYGDARAHLEQAVSAYDRKQHAHLAYLHGQDPCVAALLYLSWVLWAQGYPEQAVVKMNAGLDLAKELDHPYTLGLAASFAALTLQRLRQLPECQAQAVVALEIGAQGLYPLLLAMGSMVHGWATAHQGYPEEGIAEVEQGLALWEGTGARLALPYLRTHLAGACLAAGRREDGLKAIEQPPLRDEQTWWLPEQHRIRAELLLLAPGNESEAEGTLWQALDLARSQNSRSLELRVAMSLARLLRQRGRAFEGRDLLAECYVWFTEGFDTADLREARELLDMLDRDAEQAPAVTDDQSNGTGEASLVFPAWAPYDAVPLTPGTKRMTAAEGGESVSSASERGL
jgi:tetratricopeptide (TPR) repeat protein